MVVWTLNCVWSDEGICHGGSCSGAEKRRWRWGSDISAMRLCTVFSAAIVNYLDVNYLCLMYSCTQSRQFMQRHFVNCTLSEHWIGLETEVPSQQCEEFSTRQGAKPPSVFFSAQCASVWGGFQTGGRSPSVHPAVSHISCGTEGQFQAACTMWTLYKLLTGFQC